MKFNAIDNKSNLWRVTDVYSLDLIQQLETVPFKNLPFEKMRLQERYSRDKFLPSSNEVLRNLDNEIEQYLPMIEEVTGRNIIKYDTIFFYDNPGFHIGIHEDNSHIEISMQIYLNDNLESMGTTFYNSSNKNDVRFKFPFVKNTGYLMINESGQWHGQSIIVPKNTLRLSSYTYFYCG